MVWNFRTKDDGISEWCHDARQCMILARLTGRVFTPYTEEQRDIWYNDSDDCAGCGETINFQGGMRP